MQAKVVTVVETRVAAKFKVPLEIVVIDVVPSKNGIAPFMRVIISVIGLYRNLISYVGTGR